MIVSVLLSLAAALCLALLAPLPPTAAAKAPLSYRNPLRDVRTGKALSCPDPHVIDVGRASFRYFMVCTTDRAANGIAILRSHDLVNWDRAGYVFPKRRQPWWSSGRFWAPEIHRIGKRWVVYFAASVDRSKVRLPVKDGTMVLGVASAPRLRGPWRTRILHYRGQADPSTRSRELFGGTIDPSVVRNPLTGQLYLFWALQATQIWVGRLSPDGLTLDGHIRRVQTPSKPWECHPTCTVEAPAPFYRGGTLNLLYSAASTWDGSYVVGLALGTDPLTGTYRKLDQPVLRGGGRFIATGSPSQPVIGPDGQTYILYHALTSPDPKHVSNRRLLMIARVSWMGDQLAVNGNGRAE